MASDIIIIPNRGSTTSGPVIQFSGSYANSIKLEVLKSGSVAFLGNSGSLFSIVDSMAGSLMAVSDISGLPILEVFSDDKVVMGKYNSNALVVTGSSVGIGTASPISPLHVAGGTAMTGGWNRSLYLSATFPVIVFNSNNTKYSGIGVDYSNAASGIYFWVNGSSADISGTATVALGINTGNFVSAGGSFRAPIFYDSNNTSYYVDPTGTSVLNQVNGVEIYSSAWFRNSVSNAGLYNQITTQHLSSNTNGYWDMSSTTNISSIRFYTDGHVSALRGYVYSNDSNEIGFLNSTGNWSAKFTSQRSDIYNNTYVPVLYANYIYDRDETAYYVDPNSTSYIKQLAFPPNGTSLSSIYIGNGSVSTTDRLTINFHTDADLNYYIGKPAGSWTQPLHIKFYTGIRSYAHQSYDLGTSIWNISSGNVQAAFGYGGDNCYLFRTTYSPIVYDYNDTGYYIDPNSYSNLNQVSAWFKAKDQTTNWVTGFQNTPVSGMTWHGDVSSGGPTGTWWFYESMRHSNSSNYWGTQIAYGWEDNANEIYQRNVQGGNFGGWVRYLNTNNYAGILNTNIQISSLGIGTAASGAPGEIRATGEITAYYSDERLKTKLGPIENPIEKIKSLSGFYFAPNDTAMALGYKKTIDVGVSAQEVQAVLPEIIAPAPIDPQYMTVRYEKLIPLLIETIKEQQKQIESLTERVSSLEKTKQ